MPSQTDLDADRAALYQFLKNHRLLRSWFDEDLQLQRSIRKRGTYLDEEVPQAVVPEAFAPLLHQTALASGVGRRKGENVFQFLRRAFSGKTIEVLGSRYGMLLKVFALFGARPYGVDIDDEAIRVCKKRKLVVKTVSAADLNEAFPKRKPDFSVSWCFFEPWYWAKPERRGEV